MDTSLVPSPVPPQAVFQTERYGEFTYTIPNRTPGSAQTVTLYFQESYWTAAGQRTFNVAINGATVLTAFDIFAAAGGANRAIARTFQTTANASGQVVIQFTRAGGPDNPKICGITVTGGSSQGGPQPSTFTNPVLWEDLSADGFSQVRSQQVFTTPSSIGTLEGARFYKRNGFYYIWLTRPANGQYVLRSTSPSGPYTIQQVLLNMGTPVPGSGVPHQGGMVQTQNGDWYYMAFIDAYPGGRVPVLAPIDWVSDWPVIRTVNGAWGATYPRPNLPLPPRAVKPPTGTDTFTGTALGPEWEWNHNPDNTRWSVGSGLRLQTATVTNDLYQARNTLTHRILGPTSTATIVLNYSGMRDGDRAGLALFRDLSAWVGVRRDAGATRVAFVNNLNMNGSWATVSTGTEVTSAPVSGGRIWLRLAADIRPGTGRQGRFSYSTDGVNYTQLGTYTMGNAWQFFMGYRYGIFN
ncbi:MAG TPA: malectin domain-containing carbohydrate-binding protein, partial [Anaeromyxobacter sp.]|nr:malectin domain-containing carbohydrate-binding protein [Anaeromyxobacter sp.]